jgi:hypothetical protein
MSSPDGVTIALISGGAAIAGGLLTGAYQHGRDYLTRPILKIDYPDDGSTLTEATYPVGEGQEKRQQTRRYVRVRVQNVGKRIAQNCRVFLTDVKRSAARRRAHEDPIP